MEIAFDDDLGGTGADKDEELLAGGDPGSPEVSQRQWQTRRLRPPSSTRRPCAHAPNPRTRHAHTHAHLCAAHAMVRRTASLTRSWARSRK